MAAIIKRMIISFLTFCYQINSGTVHFHAEFITISLFSVELRVFIVKTQTGERH